MRSRRPDPETQAEAVRRGDVCGFARLLGMEVTEVADGCVRVAMQVDGMENAHGTIHGGAIFALADHAFGIAANLEGVDQIAISAHIHYFSPPTTSALEAVADGFRRRRRRRYMPSMSTPATGLLPHSRGSGSRPVFSRGGFERAVDHCI